MRYRASGMPPTAVSSRHEGRDQDRHQDTGTANVGKPPARSRAALLVVPAAVAVTGALLAMRLHFQPPTVPVFALVRQDAHAGQAAQGAQETEVVHGGHFELEARPASPVTGAIGARAFLLRGSAAGREVRPWDPPFLVARDGSVRISGNVDSLFAAVPAGSWELAVAIGRPETLPTAPNDILRAEGSEGSGTAAWRLVRERVRLVQ